MALSHKAPQAEGISILPEKVLVDRGDCCERIQRKSLRLGPGGRAWALGSGGQASSKLRRYGQTITVSEGASTHLPGLP